MVRTSLVVFVLLAIVPPTSGAEPYRFSIDYPTAKVFLLSSKAIEFVGKRPKAVPPAAALCWSGFFRVFEHEAPPSHGVFELDGKPVKPTITVLGQTNRRLAADVGVDFKENAFDVSFRSPGKATFRAAVGKYWSQDIQIEIRQLPAWREMSATDFLEQFGLPRKKYRVRNENVQSRKPLEFWSYDDCPGYLFEMSGNPGRLRSMQHDSQKWPIDSKRLEEIQAGMIGEAPSIPGTVDLRDLLASRTWVRVGPTGERAQFTFSRDGRCVGRLPTNATSDWTKWEVKDNKLILYGRRPKSTGTFSCSAGENRFEGRNEAGDKFYFE